MRRLLILGLTATLLLLAGCGGTPTPTPSSGVFGILVINRGGMMTALTTPSPLPYGFGSSTLVPYSYGGSTVVVTATSGPAAGTVVARVTVAKGAATFRVALSPGSYALSAGEGLGQKTVVVRSDDYARVVLQAGVRHGSALPLTLDRIPAQLLPPDAPVPVSPEILRVTNSWIVCDGVTLLEVCAGAAGDDSHTGRFFFLRMDNRSVRQKLERVDVPHAGALTIVDPPTGTAVETSAQHGALSFVGRGGVEGTLDLNTDKVTLR